MKHRFRIFGLNMFGIGMVNTTFDGVQKHALDFIIKKVIVELLGKESRPNRGNSTFTNSQVNTTLRD